MLKDKPVRRHRLFPGDAYTNSAAIGLEGDGANTAVDETPRGKEEGGDDDEEGSIPRAGPEQPAQRHIRVPVSQKDRLVSRRGSLARQSSLPQAGISEMTGMLATPLVT